MEQDDGSNVSSKRNHRRGKKHKQKVKEKNVNLVSLDFEEALSNATVSRVDNEANSSNITKTTSNNIPSTFYNNDNNNNNNNNDDDNQSVSSTSDSGTPLVPSTTVSAITSTPITSSSLLPVSPSSSSSSSSTSKSNAFLFSGDPTILDNYSEKVIRVYLLDGSYRAIKIDPMNVTVEELWEIVSDKLMLTPTSCQLFFLWGLRGNLELLLYTHQKIASVFQDWHIYEERYNPKGLSGEGFDNKTLSGHSISNADRNVHKLKGFASETLSKANKLKTLTIKTITQKLAKESIRPHTELLNDELKLLFRTTSIVRLAEEQACTDVGAVDLFYIQAVYNVIFSNYPCSVETAVKLGGIQLQITIGDRNPSTHVTGYLCDVFDQYVPLHLQSKMKPQEWENLLVAEHEAHKGKDSHHLKRSYLSIVRQWKHYGCTFFKARYVPFDTAFFSQEFEGKVRIGVNENGVHLIDPKVMKIITIPLKDVVEWNSSKHLFSMSVASEFSGKRTLLKSKTLPSKKYQFHSAQSELINDFICDWMEAIRTDK